MYSAKLTKIDSNHKNLRTDEIVGIVEKLPEIGSRFVIVSDALTPGTAFRRVTTSPVSSIEILDDGSSMVFSTMNSQYGLEYEEISQ